MAGRYLAAVLAVERRDASLTDEQRSDRRLRAFSKARILLSPGQEETVKKHPLKRATADCARDLMKIAFVSVRTNLAPVGSSCVSG